MNHNLILGSKVLKLSRMKFYRDKIDAKIGFIPHGCSCFACKEPTERQEMTRNQLANINR